MIPKYRQVADRIIEYITAEDLRERRLPSERELAVRYDVSRQTIREALDLLIEDNYIYKKRGSGIYVSDSYFADRNHVALLIESEEDYICPVLISDIRSALRPLGYSLDVYATYGRSDREYEILVDLLSHPVRGVISYPVKSALPSACEDLYPLLAKKNIPVVFCMDRYRSLPGFPCVRYDDIYGSYLMTKELLRESGHIHGIFIADSGSSLDRYTGFINAVTDEGLRIDDDDVIWLTHDDIREYRSFGRIRPIEMRIKGTLSDRWNDAVVLCHNDETAAALIDICTRSRTPALIYSFDRSYLSRLEQYGFVSFSPDKEQLARETVKKLFDTSDGKKSIDTLLLPIR